MSVQIGRSSRYRIEPPASGRPAVPLGSPGTVEASGEELVLFHELFRDCFQRREQRDWSLFYLCGRLANLKRKTSEPLVLNLQGADPNAVRALQRFLTEGQADQARLRERRQALIAECLGSADGVVIADGSGFPKQGQHSAGVARQYCGALGKVANCQQGVFLAYASAQGYAFLDERLYLPELWFTADYRERWTACGIPPEVPFQTEPELALAMLNALQQRGVVPFRWVTADETYGKNPQFVEGIAALGKWYLLEVPANTRVWLRTPAIQPPGRGLLGRPRTRARVAPHAPPPVALEELVKRLPSSRWQRRIIKQGSKGPLVADFALLRATVVREKLPGPRAWVMIRRSLGTQPALKYYVSNAPTSCPAHELIRVCGMRWPIETAFEEGKDEVGMDHYETRSWQGWHQHMAHAALAQLFLMRLRLRWQKKSGVDDGASTPVDRTGDRRRVASATQCARTGSLPATTQSPCLSLPSQTYPATSAAPG